MKELAKRTGGVYVTSLGSDQVTRSIYFKGIKKVLEDAAIKGEKSKRWNEYFQLPLALAIAIFIIPPIVRLSRQIHLTTSTTSLILAACLFAGVPRNAMAAPNSKELAAEAWQQYRAGEFSQAVENFTKATQNTEGEPRYFIGLWASYYRLNDFAKAFAAYKKAYDATPENALQRTGLKAEAYHNAGNSLVQLEKYKEAVSAYEKSLEIKKSKDTEENLEYVKKLIEEPPQQSSDQQDKQDQQQEQQQQLEQQDQEQKKQDKNKKDKSDEQGQEQKQDKPEKSEQDQQQQEQKQGQQDKSQQEEQSRYDQSESLLDSVEEKRNQRNKYRAKKAHDELKKYDKQMPKYDW